MADKGGQTTQAGIDYQNKIAVLFLGRMIDPGPWPKNEEIIAVRNEDPSAEVDDVVVRYQDHTEWIQVKLDMKDAGKTWIKFWKHMITQWWNRPLPNSEQDRLVLVISQTPEWVKQLEEICGRAYGSRQSPELATLDKQVAEWQARLSETQKVLIDNIVADMSGRKRARGKPEPAATTDESLTSENGDSLPAEYLQPAALFELFSHMQVWTQFNPDKIKSDHGHSYMPEASKEWWGLFADLLELSGDHARYGKSISREDLMRELSQRNIVIMGSASRRQPLPQKDEMPDPGDLPPASRLPFPRYAKFTGRQTELLALAKALFYEQPEHRPIVVLTAMGGMGKSQLAVELAFRYGRFLDGVHWINAATGIPTEIVVCGQALQLERWPDKQDEQVAATLKAWQEGAAGGELRLVVLDNLEDPALLGEWLPRLGGLRLLVTTRRTDFEALGGVHLVELHSLPRTESLALLRKLAPHLEGAPDTGLEQVAERLGDLPLGLQLAGSYMGVSKLNLQGYLDLLQQKGGDLAKLALPERLQANPLKRELNLWYTFGLSWNQLRADDPSDQLARQLFLVCGYCAANTVIPLELLQAAVACETVELNISLEILYSLGPLQRAAGGPTIHPLLAEYARGLDLQAEQSVLPALAQALGELANQANRTGFPQQRLPLRPHLPAVGQAIANADPARAADLWNEMGSHLFLVADYAAARPYMEHELTIRRKALGEQHPGTATSLNNLGSLLMAMGDLDGARPYLEQALAIRKQVIGEQHIDTATSLNNLGSLLQAMGDLAGARPYLEQALAIRRQVIGEQHPHTASSLNNMGSLLQAMGDLPAARAYYEQALAIQRQVLGEQHPDTAISLNNLGILLQNMGDLPAARPCYEQALAIRRQVLGEQHPDTAASLHNLCMLLIKMGKFAEWLPFLKQSATIQNENNLGNGGTHE
jgi:tetratricopeptide (TPR) repeat protein